MVISAKQNNTDIFGIMAKLLFFNTLLIIHIFECFKHKFFEVFFCVSILLLKLHSYEGTVGSKMILVNGSYVCLCTLFHIHSLWSSAKTPKRKHMHCNRMILTQIVVVAVGDVLHCWGGGLLKTMEGKNSPARLPAVNIICICDISPSINSHTV